jgi:hypothetical protein
MSRPEIVGFKTWTIKQTAWVPPVWMASDGVLDLTLVVLMCVSLHLQRTGFRRYVDHSVASFVSLVYTMSPINFRFLDIVLFSGVVPTGSSIAC